MTARGKMACRRTLAGLGPWVVHAAAAMTCTLLLLLAKGRVEGGAGWTRALLAADLNAVASARCYLDPAALAGPRASHVQDAAPGHHR